MPVATGVSSASQCLESGWSKMRVLSRSAVLALSLLASLLSARATTRAMQVKDDVNGSGYWHTSGTQIVDSQGRTVHIAGVTWYGMATSRWVPAGLNFQRYTTIMDLIRLLGYSTIRLPLSNELVERNPIVVSGVDANPELHGKHALQVLDALVDYAQQIGLKIVLDDQRSSAARPLEVNSLYEPLWYTRQYPESAWIHDWQTLALRYREDDAVIGFDLRNEPHTEGSGPWDLDAYLHRSPTWGPYRGVENPATDWRLAAARVGNAVLAVNPHLLIVVQGIPLYPDSTQPAGVASSWWAGILTPVKRYPVQLDVPHQLVYSVHEWGPRKHLMSWFRGMTYQSLENAWHRAWSFVLDNPEAPYAAPILLGEFGTCTDDPQCVDRQHPDNQARWFHLLLRFLRQHPDIGWSFFALDGTNSNDCATDNGLLNSKWNNVANLPLQADLASVQPNPGLVPTDTKNPLLPGAVTQHVPRSSTSKLCLLP